jgi:hypothetical protein
MVLTNHGSLRMSPVYRIALPFPSTTFGSLVRIKMALYASLTKHHSARTMVSVKERHLDFVPRAELNECGCLER